MLMRVSLPWPSSVMSPNARPHFMKLARAKKIARADASWAAKAAGLSKLPMQLLPVTITFHPPDRRRRDTDNALASCKSALDGIGDVIGIDDSKWRLTLEWSDPVANGRVIVSLNPALVNVPFKGEIT